MEPTREITGTMVPLLQPDIDTDQLLPKQHLSRIERSGFGAYLLSDRRSEPGFPLTDPRFAGASILIAGRNFGSGSSREQAAWAIRDFGFRAVVAPSYGGLFQSNCIRSGVLAVTLPSEACHRIGDAVSSEPALVARIDIAAEVLEVPDRGWRYRLEIAPATRRAFLKGLDFVDAVLRFAPEVAAYERRRASWLPTTTAAPHRVRQVGTGER